MKKDLLIILVLVYIIILLFLLFYSHKGLVKGEFSLLFFVVLIFNIYYAYNAKETNKKENFKLLLGELILLNVFFLISSKAIDVFIIHYFDNKILSDLTEMEWNSLQSELESMKASSTMAYSDIEKMVDEQYSLWGMGKSLLFTLPPTILFSALMAFLFSRPPLEQ